MKHTKTCYKVLSLFLCLAMLLPLTACGEGKKSQSEIFAMDTQMTLTAYGKNREAGLSAAESIIRSMDSMLDPDLETSTVYAMNHANGSGVAVSGQIANMISTAQTVYQRSGGALEGGLYFNRLRWFRQDARLHLYARTDSPETLLSLLAEAG